MDRFVGAPRPEIVFQVTRGICLFIRGSDTVVTNMWLEKRMQGGNVFSETFEARRNHVSSTKPEKKSLIIFAEEEFLEHNANRVELRFSRETSSDGDQTDLDRKTRKFQFQKAELPVGSSE